MIIACPECQTRYVVSPAAIGEEGRRVQCSKCRAVWYEAPPPGEAEVVPERVVLPPGNLQKATKPGQDKAKAGSPGPADDGHGGREDSLGIFGDDVRSNVPAVVGGRRPAVIAGWAMLVVFVLAVAGAAVFFRGPLEDRSAAAAALYQKWDVLVIGKKPKPAAPAESSTILQPHPSSYLTLRQSPQIRFNGDAPSLAVTIEIRNSASFDITLPTLRGVIRDASGLEIFSWVQPVDPAVVPANGVVQFEAAIENIPPESAAAELFFDWR
jgi:predicted Zn finger-like uncharacterized protein